MSQDPSWIWGKTTQQNTQKSTPQTNGACTLVGIKNGGWGTGKRAPEIQLIYLTIILKGKLAQNLQENTLPLTALSPILCICHALFKQSLMEIFKVIPSFPLPVSDYVYILKCYLNIEG